MPSGGIRLPQELKELNRTNNPTRDKQHQEEIQAEKEMKKEPTAIIPHGTKLACPKTITDSYVKKYWKKITTALIALGVLSPLDVPEVETLCLTLQKLREVQSTYITLSPFDEVYDLWEQRFMKLSKKFSELGAKYYVSPVARSKIRLDDLNIQKTQQELQKNESILSKLLENRK